MVVLSKLSRRLAAAFLLSLGGAAGAAGQEADGLTLTLSAQKDRVYAGQQVRLAVVLRVKERAVRNIGFPTLLSPPLSSSAFQLPEERHQVNGGSEETVYTFPASFTARSAGLVSFGPATLSCDVEEGAAGSAGFFGGVEFRRVTLSSGAATVEVQPLPLSGRPSSFHGAVGSFSMKVSAKPAALSLGDPLTVVTIIEGDGDLGSASCPDLSPAGGKSYPATATRRPGRLSCEQVVVPAAPGKLPDLRWAFFDPEAGKYVTLTESLARHVALTLPAPQAVAQAPPPPAAKAAVAGKKGSPERPIAPWLLLGIVTIVGISTSRRLVRKAGPVESAAEPDITAGLAKEAESAARSEDVEKFYKLAFSLLQVMISKALRCKAETVSSPPPSNAPYHAEILQVWDRCQAVLYGRKQVPLSQLRHDLQILLRLLQ